MNDNIKVPMEAIIGGNYVKYSALNNLIGQAYGGSKATCLHIYIDLYSLVKRLFIDEGEELDISDPLELSADIINLCAHYRTFFYRSNVETKFFLIYGYNCPVENASLCSGYNEAFMTSYMCKKRIRAIVDINMQSLEILCRSLPGIYFFNIYDKEVSSFIEYLLSKYRYNDKEKYPYLENMIVSKDVLPLQLIPLGCTVLHPRKNRGSDESFIICHDNFWQTFMLKVRKVKMPIDLINPTFFPNILAMTRVPERSMNSIKSVSAAYGYIDKAFQLGYLRNDQLYSQAPINKVLEIMGVNANYTELDLRWRAISSRFQSQYVIPSNPKIANIEMKDIYNPDELKSIVSKYYSKCPIDLDKL